MKIGYSPLSVRTLTTANTRSYAFSGLKSGGKRKQNLQQVYGFEVSRKNGKRALTYLFEIPYSCSSS